MGLETLGGGKSESLGFDELVKRFSLVDRLGLTDPTDKGLLHLSFFARLRRNPSSERAELLKIPMMPFIRSLPFMDRVVRELEASEAKHQEAVQKTEQELQQFIEMHYLSPEARQHAQGIISAINALVARGLARGGNSFRGGNLFRKGRPVLVIAVQDLDSWGEFWKPRINPPPA